MPNSQPWSGDERRKGNRDHDTLIELVQILTNHVQNFDKHIQEDKENFIFVTTKIDNHAKFIYMGIGAIALINVLVSLYHK